MARPKGKNNKSSTFDKKAYNGPGINWQNLRDATYTSIGCNVPFIVNRMFTEACRRGNIKKIDLYKEVIYKTIREQLGEDELDAMLEYVDKYYPPKKTPEVEAYWYEKLGITEE